jgi:hypothetical protein
MIFKGNIVMKLKFKCDRGRFDDETYSAWLGKNLKLTYCEIDGDNQPYSLEYVTTSRGFGGVRVLDKETIFEVDQFFGGVDVARQRVIYLTKCLYHGVKPELTDWEQKHLKWGNRQLAKKATPTFKLHEIFVNGTYHSSKYSMFVEVRFITNAVPRTNKSIDEVAGAPSVVFEDIFTDTLYSRSVSDFNMLGFKLLGE